MKYRCPYCEKQTFSFLRKATTGGMASKGKACPECGKHAVHGFKSTISRTILLSIVLIFIIANSLREFVDPLICILLFIGVYLFCMIINGLFFELEQNNRKDIK